MPLTVEEYDRVAHDPTQLTLASYTGDRGPYPGHPADTAKIPPRFDGSTHGVRHE